MRKEYMKSQQSKVISFRDTLDLETDRGCALLAISFLEEELKILLGKCLIEDENVEKTIFSFNGPLGTFSSKIEMAFFLGKISLAIRNEMHLLRKLRNEFGHSPDFIDFNTSNIKDRCKALNGSWKNDKSTSRQHFTASVCSVLAVLHAETYSTKNPVSKSFDFPFKENKEWYEEKISEIADLLRKDKN